MHSLFKTLNFFNPLELKKKKKKTHSKNINLSENPKNKLEWLKKSFLREPIWFELGKFKITEYRNRKIN